MPENGGHRNLAPERDAGPGSKPGSKRGSDALARLRTGELTLDEYLDDRAAHAVEPLEALIGAERAQWVRELLREELRVDPVLVEMVRQVTGHRPGEPPQH
ncbi:MAG TPA: hypothetical protein VF989_16210 [Polyangiaceae bacterium]